MSTNYTKGLSAACQQSVLCLSELTNTNPAAEETCGDFVAIPGPAVQGTSKS